MPDGGLLKPKIKSSDYQLHLPPLGDGTYGTVYRATYRGVVERAVKVFKRDVADLTSTMRELEKLSSVVEHQGIVTLHDFDLQGDVPYYVMSLHADQSKDGTWKARTLESACGQVDAREAGRLIDQIADAMAYLHRHQVLHCDLKPRNIMVTDETPPHVKICDFGQSRSVRLADAAGLGTLLYSSPEQLTAPDDWLEGKGFSWDVYSFGVVAFKLVTGELPRLQNLVKDRGASDLERTLPDENEATEDGSEEEGGGQARIAQLLEEEKEVVWPPRARIDARRKAIITRCLALDPADRPSDMREVRNAIQRQQQESRAVRSRNLAILFAAITALALLATGKALFEASRARTAIETQNAKRKEAEELVNFIVHNLSENLEPAGRVELLEHIAENAATYFSNMSSDLRTERSLRSFARILETRGMAAMAKQDGAVAMDAYRKAFNLYEQLEGDGEGGMSYRASEILGKLGEAYLLAGQPEAARETFLRALEGRSNAEESLSFLVSTARLHRHLAALSREEGDLDRALKEMDEAVELHQQMEANPAMRSERVVLVGYLNTLLEQADLFRRKLSPDQAIEVYGQLIERGRAEPALIQRNSEIQKRVAQAYRELGEIRLTGEEPDLPAARASFEEELGLREAVYWRGPTEPDRSFELARCLAALAGTISPETEEGAREALDHLQQALRSLDGVEEAGEMRGQIDALRQGCREEIAAIYRLGE